MRNDHEADRSAPAPRWAVSLYLAGLGLWTGAAVFFSAAVLPLLFLNMPPSEAGRIAALIFPVYFRAGLVVGVLTTAMAVVVSRGGSRPWRAVVALLVCMTAAQGWTAIVIHPEMARLRGVPTEVERFQELHRLSVNLNAVVLGGGVLLLLATGALFAERRDPS